MVLHKFYHSPIEFRATKDECAFQPVLDTFHDAENIWIVTYNVTASSDDLFEALRTTKAKTTLISNIPGRAKKYYGSHAETWRKNARSQIASYLQLLDPNGFSENFETWFCFDNHAKIIMTDHIAFVGSANFSAPSSRNWEAGVIVQDSEAVSRVAMLVEEIQKASIRFLGNISSDFMLPLAVLRQCKGTIDSKMTEQSLDELGLGLCELRSAVAESDKLWSDKKEAGGPITSIIDMDLLDQLEETLETAGALHEYAEFDPDDIDVGDFPSDAYGDRLETYLQSAMETNNERLEGLESDSKEDIDFVKQSLQSICEQVGHVVNAINDAKTFDNT